MHKLIIAENGAPIPSAIQPSDAASTDDEWCCGRYQCRKSKIKLDAHCNDQQRAQSYQTRSSGAHADAARPESESGTYYGFAASASATTAAAAAAATTTTTTTTTTAAAAAAAAGTHSANNG